MHHFCIAPQQGRDRSPRLNVLHEKNDLKMTQSFQSFDDRNAFDLNWHAPRIVIAWWMVCWCCWWCCGLLVLYSSMFGSKTVKTFSSDISASSPLGQILPKNPITLTCFYHKKHELLLLAFPCFLCISVNRLIETKVPLMYHCRTYQVCV